MISGKEIGMCNMNVYYCIYDIVYIYNDIQQLVTVHRANAL